MWALSDFHLQLSESNQREIFVAGVLKFHMYIEACITHEGDFNDRNFLSITDETEWQTDRQADRQTDRQKDKQTDQKTDRKTSRQTDKQTDRQTDSQADRQAD